MKKTLSLGLLLFLSGLLVFSCKSSKQDDPENADAEQTEVTESAEENSDIELLSPADDKDYFGWIGNGQGIVENQIGAVKLRSRGKNGNFNVYIVNADGKGAPVFSTAQEGASTSFYLLSGKKVYKLTCGNGVISAAERTEFGMRLHYLVPKVAEVTVDFSCFKSAPKRDHDIIKVTAKVTNLKKRTTVTGLKVVMDTVLGEKSKFHFYNMDDVPIKNEVMYRTLQKSRYIVSKNDDYAVQFLLNGADITVPDFVALGNYDTLSTLEWEPNMLVQRTFDTVHSYNNSAVEINWTPKELGTAESDSYVYYMAVAAYPDTVNGASVIGYTKTAESLEPGAGINGPVTIFADNPVPKSEAPAVIESETEKAKPKPSEIDFKPNREISEEFLKPEYIKRLLDRIAELEEDEKTLNREELKLLNAELDMILQHLRTR